MCTTRVFSGLLVLALLGSACQALAADTEEPEAEAEAVETGAFTDLNTVSYYELLKVSPTATNKEVRRAYRNAARKNHPDSVTDPKKQEAAERVFIRIVKAQEILVDPMKRVRYNEMLKLGMYDYDEEAWQELMPETFDYFPDYPMGEEPIPDEAVDTMLGWTLIATVTSCVLPIVYGLYTQKKKKKVGEVLKNRSGASLTPLQRQQRARQEEVERQRAAKNAARERQAAQDAQRRSAQKKEREREEQRNKTAGTGAQAQVKSKARRNPKWSSEEVELLDQALKRFPSGTARRLENITNYVNKYTADLPGARGKGDVEEAISKHFPSVSVASPRKTTTKKSKPKQPPQEKAKKKKKTEAKTKAAPGPAKPTPSAPAVTSAPVVPLAKQVQANAEADDGDWAFVGRKKGKQSSAERKQPDESTTAPSPSSSPPPEDQGLKTTTVWTDGDQQALDAALMELGSKTTQADPKWWVKVAERVPGKGATECKARFAEVRERLRQQRRLYL